jgi:hypothetical protein
MIRGRISSLSVFATTLESTTTIFTPRVNGKWKRIHVAVCRVVMSQVALGVELVLTTVGEENR